MALNVAMENWDEQFMLIINFHHHFEDGDFGAFQLFFGPDFETTPINSTFWRNLKKKSPWPFQWDDFPSILTIIVVERLLVSGFYQGLMNF